MLRVSEHGNFDRGGDANVMSSALATALRGWRRRLDGTTYPASKAGQESGRVVSQERVVAAAGVSLSWYRQLESGRVSPAYRLLLLTRVSRALALSDDEHEYFISLATGRLAMPEPRKRDVLTEATVRNLFEQRCPAMIVDDAFDVVCANWVWQRWFPSCGTTTNWMRWILTTPQAREHMVDWRDVWLPRMVTLLRAADASRPPSAHRTGIIEDVRRDRDVAEMWRTVDGTCFTDGTLCSVRPDAGAGTPSEVQIEVITTVPNRDKTFGKVLFEHEPLPPLAAVPELVRSDRQPVRHADT